MTLILGCRNVREWQLGVLFFAVGNVMNFVSLGASNPALRRQSSC